MDQPENPLGQVKDPRFDEFVEQRKVLVHLTKEIDLGLQRAKELRIQNMGDLLSEHARYKQQLKSQLTSIAVYFQDSDTNQIIYEAMNDKQYQTKEMAAIKEEQD